MKFIVKRHHFGDRDYAAGDEREAVEAEVKHLVANGVLVAKAEPPAPKNKAEKPVSNKASK